MPQTELRCPRCGAPSGIPADSGWVEFECAACGAVTRLEASDRPEPANWHVAPPPVRGPVATDVPVYAPPRREPPPPKRALGVRGAALLGLSLGLLLLLLLFGVLSRTGAFRPAQEAAPAAPPGRPFAPPVIEDLNATCSFCGKRFRVPAELAGNHVAAALREVPCPLCGVRMPVLMFLDHPPPAPARMPWDGALDAPAAGGEPTRQER